jgi:hypothetical protein
VGQGYGVYCQAEGKGRRMKDDPFDKILSEVLDNPPMPAVRVGTPTKIRKRRENFVILPIIWWERLATCKSHHTYHIAIYLLHLHWKNFGKPFTMANGMLGYDGVSRQTKWRALSVLERLGLITIERRHRKSPVIHVCLRL